MRMRTGALALAAAAALLSLATPVLARAPAKKTAPSSRTRGLGHSCRRSSDCRSRAQRCLHENDSQGKPLAVGFCVLPCSSFEAGTSKVDAGTPDVPAAAPARQRKHKPLPRCPERYQCRSAGAGVPIDMCVKE